MANETVAPQDAHGEQQLVVFSLAEEFYALDIQSVQEIVLMQPITAIPDADPWVEGITNLRGRVVPVLDLRRRCNVTANEYTAETRIVVVSPAQGLVGLIVDSVSEVLRVPDDQIGELSSIVGVEENSYLSGVARLEDRLVSLMDLDSLIPNAMVKELAKVAA